jgi:hypothetical protein
VKQSDLCKYEENAREKQKDMNIQDKTPTPPSTQGIRIANTKFKTQEGNKKTQDFSMTKDHTPPEPKTNQTKRQI